MARPKKSPEYNSEKVSQQIIEAIADAYLNPPVGEADEDGKMYINQLADEFGMSRIKIRKLLITSGAYETPMSREVIKLYNSGKTIKEIQTITGLSAAICLIKRPYTIWKNPLSLQNGCGNIVAAKLPLFSSHRR